MHTPTALLYDLQRRTWLSFADPVQVVRAATIDAVRPALDEVARRVEADGLWAAGFLSYEAGPAFDPAMQTHPAGAVPLLWLGLFRAPAPAGPPLAGPIPPLNWQPDIDRAAYDQRIAAIKDHIARGDTYQVNFTMQMRAAYDGDAPGLFGSLVRAQGPGPAAFVHTGRFVICAASPELFFTLDGDRLVSRPMKGTAPRGRTPAEDAENAARLAASEKDRAENVMIVDMVRNDMGRIAALGSVSVDRLFEVERYPTLLQMTSTVSCLTAAGIPGIFGALFPCASITGAPKISTMRIIRDLETGPRGVYTGAVGFWGPGRRAQFNVAIRTAVVDQKTGQIEYGAGSGIVWDSDAGAEYDEVRLKTRVITAPPPEFELLESLRGEPGEGLFLLDRHFERMRASAGYFGFPFDETALRERLAGLGLSGPSKVRLLLARDGAARIEVHPIDGSSMCFEDLLQPRDFAPRRAALAPDPIDRAVFSLYHKTTLRAVYQDALDGLPESVEDALLWNDAGEATEFTASNLVARISGRMITPPVDCGLLPGTLRAELLARGRIEEGVIPVAELGMAEEIWAINSVRGWQPIKLMERG